MKKYFYKITFSFLCTPIDIDYLFFLRLASFLRNGVMDGVLDLVWGAGVLCGLRGWCHMLFCTLLRTMLIICKTGSISSAFCAA